MSGYEKSQEPFIYGYAATRSDQQQSYDALTQAPAGLQYPGSQAQVPHGTLSTEQMPFIPVQQYEAPRDVSGYQTSDFPLIHRHTQQMPVVDSYTPSTYSPGTKIYIYIRSQYDLSAPPSILFTMMLGGNRVNASLSKLEEHDQQYHHFSVAADAPSFQATEWSNSDVPLSLQMWDQAGRYLNTINVGIFSYGNAESYQTYNTSPLVARKRKVSPDAGEYNRSPVKRPSTQQLRTRTREGSGTYESTPSSASPSSPFVNPGAPASYSYIGNVGRPQQQQLQNRPQQFQYQYSGTDASQGVTETQSPLMSTPHGSYASTSMRTPRTASIPAAPGSSRRPEPSPGSANPPLIRTSTIQPSQASSMQGSLSTQGFNPYAMYPSNSKAVLKIEGDLDKMSDNWTEEEWEANRRLVQFTRRQNGSVIHTNFKPVTLEERAANSICISCIWWEEKQECFVTSVDTIYLLESLVGVRFTVEEKNRIRRNLEGFHPATVSKAKQDSEEFFKIIMGFPNPKPRNIEKDVKVFPWRILAPALKKIISKYSASYSSTASALPPATGRGYGSSSGSSGLSTEAVSVSPHSRSASHGYPSSMTSTSMLPSIGTSAGSAEAQLHSAAPADFRAAIGSMVPSQLDTASTQEHNAYQIQFQQHVMQQQQSQSRQPSLAYSNLLGSNERQSWDLSSYIGPSPVAATPGGAAQALQQHYEGSMTSDIPGAGNEPATAAGAQASSTAYHGMSGYHLRGPHE